MAYNSREVWNEIHDPTHEGVIDQLLDEILGGDTFNHHCGLYAIEEVRKYVLENYPDKTYLAVRSAEWFNDYINSEEFRHAFENKEIGEEAFLTYQLMFELYHSYRSQWFALMIGELNQANIRQQSRLITTMMTKIDPKEF